MNKDIINYIAASYPILWVDTIEYERAIQQIENIIKPLGHKCIKWDPSCGITDTYNHTIEFDNEDALRPVHYLLKQNQTVIFVQDYHKYLNNNLVWRQLLNSINDFKKATCTFVIVSPVVEIPPEIDRYITIINFDLPSAKELEENLINLCDQFKIPIPENKQEIINCGLGLTAFEFENAVCLSISTHGKVLSSAIDKQKEQLVMRNANLTVTKFDGGFETLVGMDNLKTFTKKMVGKGKGILLLGVPGAGKSHFAKTLGKETGRITISMDFGNLMGSFVGETEHKTKEALRVIDMMEPAILFIDEIEKGLSGVSGTSGDGGTSQRQGGQFLRWLNDHTSDVYVVATSNDISKLPPEFLRAERWDAIFFIDIPNSDEQKAIFEMYKKQYNIPDSDDNLPPTMIHWTGAEIKTLCRIASAMEIPLKEAANYVCRIFDTMREQIFELQGWSKGRTIPVSNKLKYKKKKKDSEK